MTVYSKKTARVLDVSAVTCIAALFCLCIGTMAFAQTGANEQAATTIQKSYMYKTVGERELRIEFDFPLDWKAEEKRPVIVFFFGGGWTGGSVVAFEKQAAYFATRGLVAARADYRIKSKDNVTPDQCVEDARDAVRWIRKNAKTLGVDPKRLISSGGSAGGHLAACMAIADSVESKDSDLSISTIPQAMVLFNPVLDFTHEQLISRINGDHEIAGKISPIIHLDKTFPPALILFGDQDRLKLHGDEYWKKAAELGVRADKYIAEGMGHGFFNRSPWRQRTLIEADKFLESLEFIQGKPTMTVPEGEELKALMKAEQKKKRPKRKDAATSATQ